MDIYTKEHGDREYSRSFNFGLFIGMTIATVAIILAFVILLYAQG